MFLNLPSAFSLALCFAMMALGYSSVRTQTVTPTPVAPVTIDRFLDQINGMTADEAVRIAIANNGDLEALRREADAARSLIKQARLRANPSVSIGGAKMIGGMDNSQMAEAMLPLELGGRRSSRIRVAEREAAVRQKAVEDRERSLAAEVRIKFGEALAEAFKLRFTEEAVSAALEQYRLVQARVTEGKTAPLEESMTLVEVNRLRSMRETAVGKTEIAFLELRNLLGMRAEEPVRLMGDFDNMIASLPVLADAVADAINTRPDLAGLRAIEELSTAQIEQAKAGGRLDASVRSGYQRMRSGFPLNGLTESGELRPIDAVFNSFTFGVTIELPLLNRNQGEIEAATANREAARNRREFGELIVRREVATAFARYESAARAMEIFRVGVRDQAAANLAVIRQMYELGSRNLIEYLIEERRFIEIENEYIDMQLAVYQAYTEMMRATNSPELIKR